VNEINDAALVALLRRQMTQAVARQVVAAGNLANIDTPNFRAREVDFDQTLGQAVAGTLATTHPGHLASGADAPSGPLTREVAAAPVRRDGNSVQIDRELLTMTDAAGDFARAQTVLAAKFRLVRYALSESR
jgi:flagellar basal-body rod protein FlgB